MTTTLSVSFPRRLGVRIFATILAVALVAVLLAVGLLALESGRVLRESISERNLRIAHQAALETARIVEESIADLEAMVLILGPLPYADWIRGTVLANVTLEYRQFSRIRLVRGDGTTIADSRPDAAGEDISTVALAATLSSRVWVSPVRLSTEDYTPTLLVGVPLRLIDGQPGALFAELRLRDIWGLLDEIGIGGTGAAYVISDDGVLIGHTDMRVLLTPSERQRIPRPPAGLPENGAVLAVKTAAGTMLTAYAAVPGRDWVVAVEQPIVEAFLPVETLVRQSLLLVAIAAVVAAAVGFLFSRRISAPLAALVVGSRALAAGDFASRLPVARPDEVGAVAAAFNEMAGALEQRDRELAASERKYRLITEHATDLIFSLDAGGRCSFASGRIRALTGRTPEEVVGRRMADIFCAPSPAEMWPPGNVDRHTLLVEVTSPNGRRVPLEITFTRSGESGDGTVWYGVARDITERRQLEEQLFQAQKMEAVGQLAGGVAHDFNNLLTAILGYSEIALMDADITPKLRKAVEQVRSAGKRAASLTQQLLAFSRRQVLVPQPLDLNSLLAGMEEMLRRLIGEQVALVLRTAPRLGLIHADAGQIEQVVMNLCVNARDAMPDGGEIEIVIADDADGRIRLTVRDTGTGMAPEVMAHLFEPFFTTKAPGKGTGLGLSTVYGIVRQSGGEIACTSDPGAGTTFVISFPRAGATAAAAAAALSAAPPGGRERVLVVEDDAALRGLVVNVLSDAGYTVLAAGSAEEAQERYRGGGAVQALVTDLVLPGTNGRRLAEELRRADPWLAVLMISGYTADTLDDYEALAGSTAFLQKPFLPVDLLARLRVLLDGGSAARAAAPPAR